MLRLSEEAFLRRVFVWLMLAALWPVSASALTLEELSYGEHASGPNLSTAQLKGKVVLVDFWGTECGPCIAQLPSLQSLYSRYRDDGFHLIAMERQRHKFQDVLSFLNDPAMRAMGLQFQITCGDHSIPNPPSVPGRYTPTLPTNFLFGPDGNMVATALHGDGLERAVAEQVAWTWTKLIDVGETNLFRDLAAKLKTGSNLMETLSVLAQRKRDSKDPAEVNEATRLMFAVFAAAKKKFEKAQSMQDRDPLGAMYKFEALAADLQGTQIAERAKTVADALRSGDRVQNELKAESSMRTIITLIADLKPGPNGARMPDDPGFRGANYEGLKLLETECRRVFYSHPGTTAGEHVRDVVKDFMLNLGQQ